MMKYPVTRNGLLKIALCASLLFCCVFSWHGFPAFAADQPASQEKLIPFSDPTGFTPEDPKYVGGDKAENAGSKQIVGTLQSVITFLKYFAGIIAFVWLVWSGIRMISAGDSEDEAKKGQMGVTYSIVALLLIVMVEPLITQTLFGGAHVQVGGQDVTILPGEQLSQKNIAAAVGAGKLQILELVQWVEAMVIFLGVAYLIFSGWRFLQDVGGEEEISKQKTVLLWMAVGFILIALDRIIVEKVFYGALLPDGQLRVQFIQNPARGIAEIVGILNYFLQFLAVIAIVMFIYAGVLLITNFGNEENKEKGKKILIAAGTGFLIILTSYILVNALIMGRVF